MPQAIDFAFRLLPDGLRATPAGRKLIRDRGLANGQRLFSIAPLELWRHEYRIPSS